MISKPSGGQGVERALLESVDLDVILLESVFAHLALVLVGEKVHHFGAMIPLELDHLAHVLVLNDGAIASCSRNRGVSEV